MKTEHKLHIFVYCGLISFMGIVFSSVAMMEGLSLNRPIIGLFGTALAVLFGGCFLASAIGFKSLMEDLIFTQKNLSTK